VSWQSQTSFKASSEVYLTRAFAQICIVFTDPDAMIAQQRHNHNLFFSLEKLEQAMIDGQAIKIYQTRNPYAEKNIGLMIVFPLQLLYQEVAWYLICEVIQLESFVEKTPYLLVERVDRFSEEFNLIPKYLSPPPLN
jgi:hypothetical protein